MMGRCKREGAPVPRPPPNGAFPGSPQDVQRFLQGLVFDDTVLPGAAPGLRGGYPPAFLGLVLGPLSSGFLFYQRGVFHFNVLIFCSPN